MEKEEEVEVVAPVKEEVVIKPKDTTPVKMIKEEEVKPISKESSFKTIKTPPPTYSSSNKAFEKSPEFQYPISAYNSDSEYEDDEEEEDNNRRSKGDEVEWTKRENLYPALLLQASIDPDTVFGSAFPSTCDLERIFGRRKFRPRSSSVNWSGDRLQKQEEYEYKKAMGYK